MTCQRVTVIAFLDALLDLKMKDYKMFKKESMRKLLCFMSLTNTVTPKVHLRTRQDPNTDDISKKVKGYSIMTFDCDYRNQTHTVHMWFESSSVFLTDGEKLQKKKNFTPDLGPCSIMHGNTTSVQH